MYHIMKKLSQAVLLSLVMYLPVHANELVVGGKGFTEQRLLTEITAQYLEKEGYEVQRRAGLGSTVLRSAQENGQIDLYWEYTGTSLLTFNKVTEKLPPTAVYQRVKELDAKKGLIWMNSSKANNTYAFAMRRNDSEKRNIKTLSELAATLNSGTQLSIAVNAEFYARKDGLLPLQEFYGFAFPRDDIKRMDGGLTYLALKQEYVDVSVVFATDGRIPAFDLKVLEDDLGYFPSYAIAPIVREDTLKENPTLEPLLNNLSAVITDQTMSALNAKVDVEHLAIEKVAKDFLQEMKL